MSSTVNFANAIAQMAINNLIEDKYNPHGSNAKTSQFYIIYKNKYGMKFSNIIFKEIKKTKEYSITVYREDNKSAIESDDEDYDNRDFLFINKGICKTVDELSKLVIDALIKIDKIVECEKCYNLIDGHVENINLCMRCLCEELTLEQSNDIDCFKCFICLNKCRIVNSVKNFCKNKHTEHMCKLCFVQCRNRCPLCKAKFK